MATITSTGIGSGLDINTLVSQLVAAERAAPEQRIVRSDARLTTEFTALATLKGAMSSFQGALSALKSPSAFELRKAAVGEEKSFSASVSAIAVAGNYDVEVVQLATAARAGSSLFPTGPDSVVGTGTLSLAVGAKSFSVEITAANQSLAQIRDAINAAPENDSVHATLIRDTTGTGSYLVLTSSTPGAANSITVSATGADAGMTTFVQGVQTADPVRDVVAQDAIINVSGYEIHSTTNKVSGAIDGVTLDLKQAEPGKLVKLAIDRDDAAIQKKVEVFVSAYNVLAQQIKTLSRYDAATKTAGPMLGDSMLRGMEAQIRRMISEPVAGTSGSYTTLASLGISTTATGTLALDSTKLKDALDANPAAVSSVFSSESGVAVRLAKYMDERLSITGELATRDAGITSRRKDLEKQQEALDARMVVIQARYMKQFTALDTMLSQLQSTSNYLTQQLEGISNLNNSGR